MDYSIYAVVITYNSKLWYERCFTSLKNSNIPMNVIVVDNASTDDTVEYIERNFPQFILIKSKDNLGFAKANNTGIRMALDNGADYIFLLNHDAWIEKNTIEKLIYSINVQKDAGIVSPLHLNKSKDAFEHDFAKIFTQQCHSNILSDCFFRKINTTYEVDFINAAAWLMTRDCIEAVGGFNTLLFSHYGEDDNYCQRLKYHGLKIIINTDAIICHDSCKNDANHKKSVFADKNIYLQEKIRLGDINLNDGYVKNECRIHKNLILLSMLKSIFVCKMKKVKSLVKDYALFSTRIVDSRFLDKKGEWAWLEKE